MTNKRKAQMELMGLAIVVILVSIAMLFVIRFVVLQKPADFKKDFGQSQLASNMLNTMLKTTNPDCHDLTFTEIFQDCARGCSSSTDCNPNVQCNSTHDSCEYLNETARTVFGKTLEERYIQYEFFSIKNNDFQIGVVPEIVGNCTGGYKSKQFPIPVDPSGANTLFVKLHICE
jgi:hypothetical protein